MILVNEDQILCGNNEFPPTSGEKLFCAASLSSDLEKVAFCFGPCKFFNPFEMISKYCLYLRKLVNCVTCFRFRETLRDLLLLHILNHEDHSTFQKSFPGVDCTHSTTTHSLNVCGWCVWVTCVGGRWVGVLTLMEGVCVLTMGVCGGVLTILWKDMVGVRKKGAVVVCGW